MFVGVDVQFQDQRAIAFGDLRGGKMYLRFLLEERLFVPAVKQVLAHQNGVPAAPCHRELRSLQRVAARHSPRTLAGRNGARTGHATRGVAKAYRLQVPRGVVIRNEADA
ncbi:hypothetical protein D3C86_1918330 [compost metagenome]